MVITKQLLFHFSPKIEEINEIRRANYTHATLFERMFGLRPERNFRQSLNILWEELLCSTFQFHKVLLESLTDPFIFSLAIDVEKMEIQGVNNGMIRQRINPNGNELFKSQ